MVLIFSAYRPQQERLTAGQIMTPAERAILQDIITGIKVKSQGTGLFFIRSLNPTRIGDGQGNYFDITIEDGKIVLRCQANHTYVKQDAQKYYTIGVQITIDAGVDIDFLIWTIQQKLQLLQGRADGKSTEATNL
jgi:hypothetical protein